MGEKPVVGQKLYFEGSDKWTKTGVVSVLKVGRKWAELSNGKRIDIVTMIADGGGFSSPGRAYLNIEARQLEVKRQRAWANLQSVFRDRYRVPEDISLEAILKASDLLGVEQRAALRHTQPDTAGDETGGES